MGIFDKRVAFKPFEYPEVTEYKNAINHSYWLVSEWNFLSDIQDFNTKLNDIERSAIKNAMLAISQIEISVKRFWTKLGDRFPKAEFEQVGVTFGESEIRHADAYSHLLEVLGLNDDFTQLLQNPVIQGRVDYLTKYLKGASDNSNENFTLTLTLFSIFIENVSLFSQFLIIKSFNKYLNILKDIDNVVQSTQKEECYSEDTEILTPQGWRLLGDISVGDDVYEYSDGTISVSKVLHKVERNYEGDMYEIGHDFSNCLVTPDHDMVYLDKKNNLRKSKAKDIKYYAGMRVPSGGELESRGNYLSWEEKLRIAIQADGTNLYWINTSGEKILRGKDGGYTHQLRLTKDRKKKRLISILANLNIEFVKKDIGRETEFKIKYDHDQDYKEFDWVNLKDKDRDWCLDFINEVIEWDGYRSECNVGYSNTNKKSVDTVHAIAVLAGYRTNVLERVDKRGYKNCYKVSFSKKSLTPHGHGFRKTLVPYKGKVYCVTVSSGIVITRRNGKVCVAGNCLHALFGVYVIKQVQKEFPEWFNGDFYGKLYRACKKAYESESKIIDWIFEAGELKFLPKDVVLEFIKDRFNESVMMVGGEQVFEVDRDKLAGIQWFNDEIYAEVSVDFFHKKSTNYSKRMKSIKSTDLF